MDKSITLRPRLSEKTYALSESRVYVVEIPKGVNKHGVARAVEAQFDTKVVNVRIANIPGKAKQTRNLTGSRYARSMGKRSDVRKAYVTLAEGHSLPFFAAVEEEEAKEQKAQEQIDKAATKQASKEEKKTSRRGLLRGRKGKGDE